MNVLKLTVLSVLIVACSASADEKKKLDTKLVIGQWDVTNSHAGGPPKGGTVEFTKDGKIKVVGEADGMKMSFEGTYKIDGTKMVLTFKIGDREQPVELTIDQLTEKTFTTTSSAGKVELTRKK